MFLAADFDFEDAGEKSGAAKLLLKIQGIDGNQHRIFLVPVDDTGDATGASDLTGGAGACSFSHFSGECCHLGHFLNLLGWAAPFFDVAAEPKGLFQGRGYIPALVRPVNQ